MPLPHSITDVVDEATGTTARSDPAVGSTGGPAGNARLTAWTGLILLVVIIGELVTVLDVRGLISWHIVLGTLLVPLAVLKTGSTFWRVGRYYTGHRPYRTAGPPPTLLRYLGPLVVVTTLGLLGSGLALIFLGPTSSRRTLFSVFGQSIDTLTLHQVLFIAFGVAAGLHLLARLVPAISLVTGRAQRSIGAGVIGGGRRRAGVLLVALAVAALGAALVLSASASWKHDSHDRGGRPRGDSISRLR